MTTAPRPRVSLLLADTGGAAALRTTVRSVLAQTERELELLILDDERSDVAGALDELDDPRIVVVPAPGLSRAARLNLGITLAAGRHVGVLSPPAVELDASCVATLADALDGAPDCALALAVERGHGPAAHGGTVAGSGAALLLHVLGGRTPPLAAALLRSDVLRDARGFDATLPRTHEADLWLRLLRRAEIAFVVAPLVHAPAPPAIDVREDAATRAERARTLVLACDDHGGVAGLRQALLATHGPGAGDGWLELSLLLAGMRLPEVAPLLRATRRGAARDGVALPDDATLQDLAQRAPAEIPAWPANARPLATGARPHDAAAGEPTSVAGAAHDLAALATRLTRATRTLRHRLALLAESAGTLERDVAAARRSVDESLGTAARALDKLRLTHRLRTGVRAVAARLAALGRASERER